MKLLSSILIFAACLPALAQTAQKPEQPAPTFKVDVRLVNVFVTVTDANGAPVGSLTKDDFQIFEDDNPENIAVFSRESEMPLSIVLQVDASLSTRKDLKLELAAARDFVHAILRPVDAVSLYQFSEIVDELTGFTNNLKRIDQGIDQVRVGAATAMYDALYLGARALLDRQGRKVIVIITDGGDTVSKIDYPEALRSALEAEAIVYPIIVVPIASDAGRDVGGEHALIQLAHDTGGKFYYADSLPRVRHAFQKISEELRTQYLVAYYPQRKIADSDYRRIRIDVKGAGENGPYRARYRTGYYTSKAK